MFRVMDLEIAQKRNPQIDIIKALLIICVLIGHSNILPQGAEGSGEWFLALFHVPVFYIIAGYVFKTDHCKKISLLRKYFLGVYRSYIFHM